MGCWNETCLISNLPILIGTPCYGVILRRSGEFPRYNTYGMWQVESPVIYGNYNDYGSLKNIRKTKHITNWTNLVKKEFEEGLLIQTARGKYTKNPVKNVATILEQL